MAQITLTLPDGNARSYEAGVTPAQVASDISPPLAKIGDSRDRGRRALGPAQWPIECDAAIAIHTHEGPPRRWN